MKSGSFNKIFSILSALLLFSGCEFGDSGPKEIRIDTEPSGGTLTLNGTEIGRAPYAMKEPAFGKYFLRASKEGFLPVEKIIEINASSPSDLVVQLPKLTGLALFDSTPPGADLNINGVYRGKTPAMISDLLTGTYKASFTMEGYDPREMEVVISDRIPKLFNMSMKSIYTLLKIDSDPPGAAVIIDGIDKGKTPCTVDDVLMGEHTLKLIKTGYKEYIEKVNLEKTDEIPIRINLNEILATIEVISNPPDAKVLVDDVLKGRTPAVISGLRDGTYSVTIDRPGYQKATKQVQIHNKQDAKIDVTLDKSTGSLVLNILPVGSNIIISNTDHKAVSSDSPYSVDLSPGSYKVEITKAGYEPSRFTTDIELRKTVSKNVTLVKIFIKDTIVTLKDGTVHEGMIETKYPNGNLRFQTAPGIFEEYPANQIDSVIDKK